MAPNSIHFPVTISCTYQMNLTVHSQNYLFLDSNQYLCAQYTPVHSEDNILWRLCMLCHVWWNINQRTWVSMKGLAVLRSLRTLKHSAW
jgi:hypothetical protein